MRPAFWLLLVLCVPAQSDLNTLRIASYNIQKLRATKCTERPRAIANIIAVLTRYDITAIQELHEGPTSANRCLERIVHGLNWLANKGRRSDVILYQGIRAKPVGTGQESEQYAFVYRTDMLEYLDAAVLQGADFVRPPMGAKFRWKNPGKERDLFFVNIHTSPGLTDKTLMEIKLLYQAYAAFARAFDTGSGIILGDFNTGAGFHGKEFKLHGKKFELEGIGRSEMRPGVFGCGDPVPLAKWVMDDVTPTMVATAQAHDKFVLMGSWLHEAYKEHGRAAGTYRYSLGGEASDHYPIEMTLQGVSAVARTRVADGCLLSALRSQPLAGRLTVSRGTPSGSTLDPLVTGTADRVIQGFVERAIHSHLVPVENPWPPLFGDIKAAAQASASAATAQRAARAPAGTPVSDDEGSDSESESDPDSDSGPSDMRESDDEETDPESGSGTEPDDGSGSDATDPDSDSGSNQKRRVKGFMARMRLPAAQVLVPSM